MIWLRYILTPQGGVSAGRSREIGNDRPVHEVLPGGVIRGALGTAWWIEGAGDQATFDGLFGSSMTVHAAVPSVDSVAAEMYPLGWSRDKYPAEAPYIPTRSAPAGPRVAGRGWSVPRSWMTATTRAGLTRGVAEDGVLFTRRASRASVSYVGHLAVDDRTPDETVAWLTRNRRITVGGQRSVMGRCTWTCEKTEDPYPGPTLDTVALTALQPIILIDRFGSNSLDLSGAIREAVARLEVDVDVIETATRPGAIGGWHGRAGFPKPMEWALDSGSWALLHSARPVDAWSTLRHGLGIRRLEGYGAVALTSPDARPTVAGASHPPSVSTVENQRPAAGEPGASHSVRELILRIPGDDRPVAVRNLLDLAREVTRMESHPMERMRIGIRLNNALRERWCRAIPPDVTAELIKSLRTPAQRLTTVQALQELR